MKKVTLTINGVKREVTASPELVLLDYLRNDLKLTGTKQSCDRKGQCGACTVIINGDTAHSCLKKVVDLEGADVITIEGLGTPKNPHLIQEAFVLAGAVQCGFCIPGMIMATKGLLDKNPNPDDAAIKKALARNLCRCTGYAKIIDAVKLAGRFLRGETTPAKVRAEIPKGMIGASHPRPSAMIKACGVAEFGADLKIDNLAELAIVHSTEFHAKIKSIDTSKAAKMPGVIGVMTADDIKGTNRMGPIVPDMPVLCDDAVRCFGDPVAAVVAETREQARAAAAEVVVKYEPLKVMKTPEEAEAPDAIQIHPQSPNLCWTQPLIKGDTEKALATSAAVVEGAFSTQMNHQAALEPEVSVAYLEGEGDKEQLIVYGRSIDIHDLKAVIAGAIGYEKVRYREPFAGGQFGIKATMTSEAITAAAALHFRRPVRCIPTLEESLWLSAKRHPFSLNVKLGADKEGHLTAFVNEYTVNKGAYFLLGFVVPTRPLLMMSSCYHIPNCRANARLVYTNNSSGGAARGAGPPQAAFAMESAMDMLAEKLGMDALEFRKINSLKVGQTKATGYKVTQWPFPELCDVMRPHFDRAKKDAAEFNKKNSTIKRGVGIASFSFGIGETGDRASVSVELTPDNGLVIYGAIADPGEGNDSMLTQIASHLLDIPMEKIKLYTRDTEKTVPMGPAAASRMTYMAGGALVNGIENLKKAMKECGAKTYDDLKKAGKPTIYEGIRQVEGSHGLDPQTGQGASFESDVHNIQMAEVEVNTESGDVKVLKMTTAVDAGVVLHPQNFTGQLQGGMDQGVGYALREEFILGKTKDWVTFKFPTMRTAFESEIIVRETPRNNGPLGAIGIGEMTMVSTAPAVTNAIHNACGVRIHHLPATPQKVKEALAKGT